jgi:hypothetical protein
MRDKDKTTAANQDDKDKDKSKGGDQDTTQTAEKDPKKNKLSHLTWQRYASSVWDDIRNSNVLEFKKAKEEDDEKHVHPLQL